MKQRETAWLLREMESNGKVYILSIIIVVLLFLQKVLQTNSYTVFVKHLLERAFAHSANSQHSTTHRRVNATQKCTNIRIIL